VLHAAICLSVADTLRQGSSRLRYSGTQELAPKGNGNVQEIGFQVGIKVFSSLLVPLAVLPLADVKTDVS
jgi:hypothetical protein